MRAMSPVNVTNYWNNSSVETLHIFKKKGGYVDRRGFHAFAAPPSTKYSLAGFNWDIQGNFRDLKIIPYPNWGRQSGGP